MAKIAIIGAGGYVFPLRLVGDILSHPELQGSTFTLMDIDAARLSQTAQAAQELVRHHGLPARVESTLERSQALRGADYVIVTFQVGGLEAYRMDVEVPRKYGLDQPVGDTLGPGGVMRFLRSAPIYKGLAEEMRGLCPEALLINYANPMAMNCWYLSRLGVKTVGLCHSVQNTTHMLAQSLGIPHEEVRFKSAGINHQAWILEFRRNGEDLYPELRETMRQQHLGARNTSPMSQDHGDHSAHKEEFSVYEGAQERVRTGLMETFGFFHTESSHHASEYVPYFRKNPEAVGRYLPQRWDYYQICLAHPEDNRDLLEQLKAKLEPSLEYGAQIIHAQETGEPAVIYGNVPNTGLIDNLPPGCSVEVACLVDGAGLQPTHVGNLPPQLAALNRSNINVQELAVEAAITGDVEHVYQAIALDPLTGALLSLEQIRAMTGELLEAQAQWLPQFRL